MNFKKNTSKFCFYICIFELKTNDINNQNKFALITVKTKVSPLKIEDTNINTIFDKYNKFKQQLGDIDSDLLNFIETEVVKNATQHFIENIVSYLNKKNLTLEQKQDRTNQLIINMKEDLKVRLWLKNNPKATKKIIKKYSEQIKKNMKSETIENLFKSEEQKPNYIIYKKYDSTQIFEVYQKMAQYISKHIKTFYKEKLSKLLKLDFIFLQKKNYAGLLIESSLMHIHNKTIFYEIKKIVNAVYLYRKISVDNKNKLKEKFNKLSIQHKKLNCKNEYTETILELKIKIIEDFAKIKTPLFEEPIKYINVLLKIYYSKYLKDTHIELLESKTNELYNTFFNADVDLFDSQVKDLEIKINKFEKLLEIIQKTQKQQKMIPQKTAPQNKQNNPSLGAVKKNIENESKPIEKAPQTKASKNIPTLSAIKTIQKKESEARYNIFETEKSLFNTFIINFKEELKKASKRPLKLDLKSKKINLNTLKAKHFVNSENEKPQINQSLETKDKHIILKNQNQNISSNNNIISNNKEQDVASINNKKNDINYMTTSIIQESQKNNVSNAKNIPLKDPQKIKKSIQELNHQEINTPQKTKTNHKIPQKENNLEIYKKI